MGYNIHMANLHVLETKIKPPRMTGNVLSRARVKESLAKVMDYRLTLLQAGAGYGKTTALSLMVEGQSSVAWYQVSRRRPGSGCLPPSFMLCHPTWSFLN